MPCGRVDLLEFALPNAATWFYFSLLLGLAVFFRFDRILSLRNWDVITLYLFVPGLLFLIEAHAQLLAEPPKGGDFEREKTSGERLLQIGYIWLIVWSVYFFLRALFDLGLEKRPALTPNLNLPGLVWLAVALPVTLGVVAVRRVPDAPQQVGRDPVALTKVKEGATAVVAVPDAGGGSARLWAERCVAIALHLAVVVALALIGSTHFRDPLTGMGMVGLYLMLPMTAYHFAQVHHVWPTVFLLWAVYAFRRPALAGALIGVAAGTVFFPFLLFPLWFGFYRERGAGRFALAFLLTSGLGLGLTAAILLWSGELRQYWNVALSLSDWQAWKAPTTEGIWTGSHWAYRARVHCVHVVHHLDGVLAEAPQPRPGNCPERGRCDRCTILVRRPGGRVRTLVHAPSAAGGLPPESVRRSAPGDRGRGLDGGPRSPGRRVDAPAAASAADAGFGRLTVSAFLGFPPDDMVSCPFGVLPCYFGSQPPPRSPCRSAWSRLPIPRRETGRSATFASSKMESFTEVPSRHRRVSAGRFTTTDSGRSSVFGTPAMTGPVRAYRTSGKAHFARNSASSLSDFHLSFGPTNMGSSRPTRT